MSRAVNGPMKRPLSPKQRKRYEVALKEIEKDLAGITEEIAASQRLTADDFNIFFSTR